MSIFTPHIPTEREEYEFESWTRNECYRFYVEVRRGTCSSRQLLDLWLRAPYCDSCALSDAFYRHQIPEISPSNWEDNVAWSLGEDRLVAIREILREDPEYSLTCKKCGRSLRPWCDDDVWVVSYHLEEHYGIAIEATSRKASRRLRDTIFTLYYNQCFECGSPSDLHIDHVLPRSKGGTAAFRNLQPLCEPCGQVKGNDLPEEVTVFSDLYFDEPPSDGYEGLFW